MQPNPDLHRLVAAAIDASRHAHAPYSSFTVGAALLDTAGRIWTGCNVENASFGLTVCAERTALFKAISESSRTFVRLAIVAPGPALPLPCGACLQVLQEFCTPHVEIVVATLEQPQNPETFTLGELLPHPFSFPPASTSTPPGESP